VKATGAFSRVAAASNCGEAIPKENKRSPTNIIDIVTADFLLNMWFFIKMAQCQSYHGLT
jgi:hypothetical protein